MRISHKVQQQRTDIKLQKLWIVTGKPRYFLSTILDVWKHRNLLLLLVKREIRAKYKDSSLGILWSLGRPLLTLLVYFVAIGQFLGAARAIPDFAIFVYTGLTIWSLFSDIVSSSTVSIISNAGIVKKVYLPRELFPLAATGAAFFNFVVQLVVLFIATLVVDKAPFHPELLLALVGILIVLIYGIAFGILLSALNVYLRDIQHLVELSLILLFWASPIVYSYTLLSSAINGHDFWQNVYLWNPITVAVLDMQRAFWLAGEQSSQIWPSNLVEHSAVLVLIGLCLVILSQRVFAKLQQNFAQEL